MKKNLFGTMAAAGLLAASASASAVTIDLFSTSQAFISDTTIGGGGVFSQVSTAGTDILGGYRDIGAETKASPAPAVLNATVGVVASIFNFSTDTLARGSGMVLWDGAHAATSFTDVDYTGLGGVNIGSALSSSFRLDIIFADAGFDFVITAWTDAANWSSVRLNSLAHPVPGTSFIPFLAFLDCDNLIGGGVTTCAGSPGSWNPVDFTNLGALQAVIDPDGAFTALDLSIDNISSVPEPASLVLAGLGLLALGGIRRRQNNG